MTSTERRVLAVFARANGPVIAPALLAQAASARPVNLDRLVRQGKLRRGVLGYWLPEPVDPGFLSVMEYDNSVQRLQNVREILASDSEFQKGGSAA